MFNFSNRKNHQTSHKNIAARLRSKLTQPFQEILEIFVEILEMFGGFSALSLPSKHIEKVELSDKCPN